MKITFLGATQTVTGSKYLVEEASRKYLVDCGLFQGYKELRLRNREPFPVDPHTIDAIILTHAHLDHCGYIPLLVKQGFSGKIFATQGTGDLCEIILLDAGRIQEEDTRRANQYGYTKHHPAVPLYTEEDAKRSLQLFQTVPFDQAQKLTNDLTFTFSHSGHIFGSSFVTLKNSSTTLVFSGDIGRPNDPIMIHPVQIHNADYLVMESTYGAKRHEEIDVLSKLEEIFNSTFARGGTVVIPAFAVGRTQTVLYYINQLKEQGRLSPHIPIYLDSPMAEKVTTLWKKYACEQSLSEKECSLVCSVATFVQSREDSIKLNESSFPSIIISASGMAEGGRVLHHLKHFISNDKNTVLFVGFQAGGTRGDRILRGEREIKIHGQMVPVSARIENLDSLSSHADYEEILSWLKGFDKAPKEVFITHGEPNAAESLKTKIEQTLGWKAVTPHYRDIFEI